LVHDPREVEGKNTLNRAKNREVKYSAREDARKMDEKAEIAKEKGRVRDFYKINRTITNKGRRKMAAVKKEMRSHKRKRVQEWKGGRSISGNC